MLSLRSLIVSKLLLRRLFSLLCSRRRSCSWLTSCWCFCSKNTVISCAFWHYRHTIPVIGYKAVMWSLRLTDGEWRMDGGGWGMSWTLVCTFSKADMRVSKVSFSPSILTKASPCWFSLLSLSWSSLSKWCWRWCSAWINTNVWVWFILFNH